MPVDDLAEGVKQHAHELGFELVGICPAVTPVGISRFMEWLAAGYAGEMHYLAERAEAYRHPRSVLAGVRSLVMLGMRYRNEPRRKPGAGEGSVSCYAWGEVDYHDLIHDRLKQLAGFVRSQAPHAQLRGVVDSAPLLEREFARLAGLGWVGKHTLLLNKEFGSWFFLAALLTDQEMTCDQPFTADHCGTCRACLDACPTKAFPEPYVLNATRCISYLTIELRESVPGDLRDNWDGWFFGCDICQEVCPWNRPHEAASLTAAGQPGFHPREDQNPVDLRLLFSLDEQQFRDRFRHTPLWRAKRRGVLRNAAMVLGQQRDHGAIDALLLGLRDIEPLVRAASAWALGRIGVHRARVLPALQRQFTVEREDVVRDAIRPWLGDSGTAE